MSIFDSLAVKPLFFAALALSIGLCGMTLYAYKLKSDVATAEAAKSLAEGDRDKWKVAAGEKDAAATGWRKISGERDVLLQTCQAENTRVAHDNREALLAAQKAKAKAEADLNALKKKNSSTLAKPDCVRALAQLAVSCPVESY